jgi:hypothetical protein
MKTTNMATIASVAPVVHRVAGGKTPTCSLCPGAKPRTFKGERSLRAHHNKYHPAAGTLVFVRSDPLEGLEAEEGLEGLEARLIINPVLKMPLMKAARAISGDHDLEAEGEAEGEAGPISNPVSRMSLMNLTLEDFRSCRITSSGLTSIIDAIMHLKRCSREAARRISSRILQGDKEFHQRVGIVGIVGIGNSVEFHQFSSRGGPKTPVAAFSTLLNILALVPGAEGDAIRASHAELAGRALAGDLRLISDIVNLSDSRLGTRTLTTMTSGKKEVLDTELEAAHVACATQHAGSKRSKRFKRSAGSCLASSVSKCARTQHSIVSSRWLEKTGVLDRLWDAYVDTAQVHSVLGDSRIVYFMRHLGTSMVKVGFSRDPLCRLRQLQCGNAGDLCVEHTVPTHRYAELERWIHQLLTSQGRHVRGEWFRLDPAADYSSIVAEACTGQL